MVHFQSLMPEVALPTSLPTTFTFHTNNQMDEQSTLQQQSVPTSSQSQLPTASANQQQRVSPSDERNNSNHQTHPNDYETRLRSIYFQNQIYSFLLLYIFNILDVRTVKLG